MSMNGSYDYERNWNDVKLSNCKVLCIFFIVVYKLKKMFRKKKTVDEIVHVITMYFDKRTEKMIVTEIKMADRIILIDDDFTMPFEGDEIIVS